MNHRFTFNEDEHTAGTIEAAYRRGVHQALFLLQEFIKDNGASADVVLPLAIKRASDLRGSSKAAPFLLDELFEGVKADIAKKMQATQKQSRRKVVRHG